MPVGILSADLSARDKDVMARELHDFVKSFRDSFLVKFTSMKKKHKMQLEKFKKDFKADNGVHPFVERKKASFHPEELVAKKVVLTEHRRKSINTTALNTRL